MNRRKLFSLVRLHCIVLVLECLERDPQSGNFDPFRLRVEIAARSPRQRALLDDTGNNDKTVEDTLINSLPANVLFETSGAP